MAYLTIPFFPGLIFLGILYTRPKNMALTADDSNALFKACFVSLEIPTAHHFSAYICFYHL